MGSGSGLDLAPSPGCERMYPFSSLSVKKNTMSVLRLSARICRVGMDGMLRPFSIREIRAGNRPVIFAINFWVRPELLRCSFIRLPIFFCQIILVAHCLVLCNLMGYAIAVSGEILHVGKAVLLIANFDLTPPLMAVKIIWLGF